MTITPHLFNSLSERLAIQYRFAGYQEDAEKYFSRALRVFKQKIQVRIFLRRNSVGGTLRHLVRKSRRFVICRPKQWSILVFLDDNLAGPLYL